MRSRPNIIFLMTDQQRFDAFGAVNPLVRTPRLDRLAAQGVRFSQAVCQCPVCVPSRYSVMLGLYASQTGVRANHEGITREEDLPAVPLPELLRRGGYQTAGFGKTHWNHRAPGREPSRRGFEVRAIAQDAEGPLYEESATMMAQHSPEHFAAYHEEVAGWGPGEQGLQGYIGCTSKLHPEAHRDGWVAARCLEFLDSGRDLGRPLFLYLSFLRPHAGFNPPAEYEALYEEVLDQIPLPAVPPWAEEPPGHVSPDNEEGLLRHLREDVSPAWQALPEREQRRSIARYWAGCSWLDDLFGRVLDRLQAMGELDDALIVFLSDHGEMMGDRGGRLTKMCLYEGSVRVPLVLAGSRVPAQRRGTADDRPVELVDVLPTILEAAGLPPEAMRPGRSLLGEEPRFGSFAESHGSGDEIPQRAPAYMWRTAEWKLIVSIPGALPGAAGRLDQIRGELYHLPSDPQEFVNLYPNPDHAAVRERLLQQLLMHLAASWARVPWHRGAAALGK